MLSKTRLKYIQTLGQKKFRDSEGLFIAEGPRIVEELLQEEKIRVRQVLALGNWINAHGSLAKKTELVEVTEAELERISQLNTPNQVLALVEKIDAGDTRAKQGQFTLALDGIQDPGNLGTLIRLADWYGIEKIVCSKQTADIYNPKVVQSTMGSIARVSCHYTDLADWLSEQEVDSYATVLNGRSIYELDPVREGIILTGNEGNGIQEELLKKVKERITIPRIGRAESLNAAVATGIILSHIIK